MYQLSKTHESHTRDLRTLDCFKGFLVTGGADKVMNIYQLDKGAYVHGNRVDIFEKSILSVKINRFLEGPFILAGSQDGKIYSFDQLGNPDKLF